MASPSRERRRDDLALDTDAGGGAREQRSMATASAMAPAPRAARSGPVAAVVTVPHLSFATDLLFSLEEVRAACAKGLATQNNLVTLLKSRVALERHYAGELSRMTQLSHLEELEHGTMREALGKLKAQYLNTSVQHRILANNLEEDVLRPIEALYVYNCQKAQNLTKLTNNIKKQAKVHEDGYKRDYQTFDKCFREATMQFAAAMDAGFSSTVIEQQYHVQLAQIDMDISEDDYLLGGTSLSPVEGGRPRQKSSAAAIQSLNNNSQKLVNWLLASDQQRKENVYTKAVQVLEAAEMARRKCLQSWEGVEQSRVDMYRAMQSVLTEYQQMTEHRISNLATNLRKHVVFESSALANEQYDWQMIASKIENVDFEGDIREFIMEHFSYDLETMTVNDLCHAAATSSLVFSPNSKPCRPLKKSPLQIGDLAMRKIPFDFEGNRESLRRVLVTRAAGPPCEIAPQGEAAQPRATSEPSSPRELQVEIPSASDKPATADIAQCRVCLAQDVARAIARAYELRSVQKNSLGSPYFSQVSYEAPTSPSQAQENNSNELPSSPKQPEEKARNRSSDACAYQEEQDTSESPQTNDRDDGEPTTKSVAPHSNDDGSVAQDSGR